MVSLIALCVIFFCNSTVPSANNLLNVTLPGLFKLLDITNFDENVCIEVEHDVVQLMEQRSHAETDSYYSGPIRSGSLRSESTQDHPGT